MIIEEFLKLVIPYIAGALEAVGVFIIALAGVRSLVQFIKERFSFDNSHLGIELAKAMALSLEFKLGAEIIKTVIINTLDEFIIVAAVAALRIAITFVLHWEITSANKEH